jgi:hypothetical protein
MYVYIYIYIYMYMTQYIWIHSELCSQLQYVAVQYSSATVQLQICMVLFGIAVLQLYCLNLTLVFKGIFE